MMKTEYEVVKKNGTFKVALWDYGKKPVQWRIYLPNGYKFHAWKIFDTLEEAYAEIDRIAE